MSWLINKVFGAGQQPTATPAQQQQQPQQPQAASGSNSSSGGLPGSAVSPPKPVPTVAPVFADSNTDQKHAAGATTGSGAAATTTGRKKGKVTSLDGKELEQWRKDTPIHAAAVIKAAVKPPAEVVADAQGALYLMNANGDLEIRAPRSLALLVREAQFQYAFQIYDHTGKLRLTQPVTSAMQMNYDKFNHSLIWILVLDNRTHAWSLEFENVDEEKAFKMQLAIALMEHARREAFAKSVGKNDQQWVLQGQQDTTTTDDMEDDASASGSGSGAAAAAAANEKDDTFVEAKYKPSRFSVEEATSPSAAATRKAAAPAKESDDADEEDDDDGEDGVESPPPKTKTPIRVGGSAKKSRGSEAAFLAAPVGPERNTNLAVGMANNRTFVMRGSKIGVFKHDDEDQLTYVNKIPVVRDLAGDIFSPAKAMLHQRDNKMLLLDATKEDTVFCMDLERGQVIEEWNVHDDTKIRNFAPTTKYGQLTDAQGVLGVNRNQVFSLDPRLSSKNKLAQHTTYAKAPNMSCVGANGAGNVAVGDLKGEIRMFSEINKRAKTLLPGLGDPVINIDVTEDGHYILATTAQYLLLIPTLLDSGKTGFQAAMGQEKPTPIKLQLSPADLVRYDIRAVKFTAAHFNTGKAIDEEWIVTSTGPFIITWNMKRVLRGHTKEYKIKKIYQDVVADSFRYGKEDQVVVTTTDDVYLEKRKITVRATPSKAGGSGGAAATAAAGAATAAAGSAFQTPVKAKK